MVPKIEKKSKFDTKVSGRILQRPSLDVKDYCNISLLQIETLEKRIKSPNCKESVNPKFYFGWLLQFEDQRSTW